MDLFRIYIILVIDCISLKHNGCSMLISHDVYAEVLSIATVYYDALQLILQTGLGGLGWWDGFDFVGVSHPSLPPKLTSDMLCTFRFILALEDEVVSSNLEHEVLQFDVLLGFFFPCWTKYDKASHSICMLCTCSFLNPFYSLSYCRRL